MPGVPVGELVWVAVAVMAAGVVTGLLAGLFGIGGGAAIVPVLFEVFRLLGVPEEVRMQLCVGTSLAIIAAKLLAGRETWVLGRSLPGRAGMTGCGFLVGLASSLMGISGGSLATMMMTLYGVPIHNAVATSAGLGVPITIAGTLGYLIAGLPHQAQLPPLSIGFVSVIGVVMIAPISSWIAPLGARLAHALPRRRLEIGFGLFLIAASLRFVVSLMGV